MNSTITNKYISSINRSLAKYSSMHIIQAIGKFCICIYLFI